MDVVGPAADGVGRPLAIGGYGLGVHAVEPLNAERPLDGCGLAARPGRDRFERVLLPRGQVPQEVLGRPVTSADRRRADERVGVEPLDELADRLVFLLEDAKGMRSRRRRGRRRPPSSSGFGCGTKPKG